MIFHMGSSFYMPLNGGSTSNKGGAVFKQMFCELAVALINCLVMLLVCAFVMIYSIVVLIGNILAVFGFDGFINKVLGGTHGFLSEMHGEEYAESVTEWFRVVK